MPKWRNGSIFGPGPRAPLDREAKAVFRAKLKLARRPGRLTIACVQIAHVLLDMMGADGRLDPSVETIAIKAAVNPSTVTRALARLRELGFLAWTRRLARDAATHWRVEQVSNAYVLRVPTDMQFAGAAILIGSKRAIQRRTEHAVVPQSGAIQQMVAAAGLPDLLAMRRAAFEASRRREVCYGVSLP
jgi:hypothetical protein